MSKQNSLVLTLLGAGIVLVIIAFAVYGGSSPSVSFAHFKAQGFTPSNSPDQKPSPATTASSSPSSSPSVHPATPTPTISPITATYKVDGTLTLSPSSPVCSVSKPCTAPVANHEVDIVGPIPEKTYTDSQGKFTVYLPPGNYLLTLNPRVGTGDQSRSFTITNQPITLPLTIDSGIR
ncbi:MAG TPA: hypothetical protein VGH44_05660 [Candidatus Saccharimonadia bacterium]|jgi:hypothetical protein